MRDRLTISGSPTGGKCSLLASSEPQEAASTSDHSGAGLPPMMTLFALHSPKTACPRFQLVGRKLSNQPPQ